MGRRARRNAKARQEAEKRNEALAQQALNSEATYADFCSDATTPISVTKELIDDLTSGLAKWWEKVQKELSEWIDVCPTSTQLLEALGPYQEFWLVFWFDAIVKRKIFVEAMRQDFEQRIKELKKIRDPLKRKLMVEEEEAKQRMRKRELDKTRAEILNLRKALDQTDPVIREERLTKIRNSYWSPIDMQQ